MLTPTVAVAQYPQITGEAKRNYTKMMTEERKRSDEAWAKALPIVQKEAKEGRPYIPWAGRPYDLPQADILHSQVLKVVVCTVSVVVEVK